MSKTYRNPEPALTAAQKILGGRVVTYDGTPKLAVTKDGQTEYVSAEVAARAAGIIYDPQNYDTFSPDQEAQDAQTADWLRDWLGK
jgi:hypothetical protein